MTPLLDDAFRIKPVPIGAPEFGLDCSWQPLADDLDILQERTTSVVEEIKWYITRVAICFPNERHQGADAGSLTDQHHRREREIVKV